MKNNKNDIWKVMSVILIFIILGLSIALYFQSKDNLLDFGNIKIPSKDYKAITTTLPEGQFVLCSIKDNKCILQSKGGLS